MRICLSIHSVLNRNAGAAGAVLDVGDALKELGHDVTIFSYDDVPSVLAGRSRSMVFPVYLASRLLTSNTPFDVVDASSGDAWIYGNVMRGRRPLIVTHSHGLEHVAHERVVSASRNGGPSLSWKYPLYNGGYRLWEVSKSFRVADLCFFLNRDDLNYAVNRLGVDERRCFVIPNGCSDALLDASPAEFKPLDHLNIVQLGRYTSAKGIAVSAAALRIFLSRNINARVWFLGVACPASRVLQDFPVSLHAQIQVTEHYERENLPKLLADQHILLFPSLSEGFGIALVEGMACGLAPVVSDIPGPREIVTDGLNALTIPPGDASACLAALNRLADDRDLLERLMRNARERAESYRWRAIAETRVALYERFLAEKRQARL